MYVYVHINVCIRTYVCPNIHEHIYMCICMYINMSTYKCVCIWMSAYISIKFYIRIHKSLIHALNQCLVFSVHRRSTATHCNTLRHTATHCNTLQHTTIRCNTLHYTATRYNTLQRNATNSNTPWINVWCIHQVRCTHTTCFKINMALDGGLEILF